MGMGLSMLAADVNSGLLEDDRVRFLPQGEKPRSNEIARDITLVNPDTLAFFSTRVTFENEQSAQLVLASLVSRYESARFNVDMSEPSTA